MFFCFHLLPLPFGVALENWWHMRISLGICFFSIHCMTLIRHLTKDGLPTSLGGGFKYFLFSPVPGEMIQFD